MYIIFGPNHVTCSQEEAEISVIFTSDWKKGRLTKSRDNADVNSGTIIAQYLICLQNI